MENKEVVRVVFYVRDNFENPHFLRKAHIGYVDKDVYEKSVATGTNTFFAVGNDLYARTFPETITK